MNKYVRSLNTHKNKLNCGQVFPVQIFLQDDSALKLSDSLIREAVREDNIKPL